MKNEAILSYGKMTDEKIPLRIPSVSCNRDIRAIKKKYNDLIEKISGGIKDYSAFKDLFTQEELKILTGGDETVTAFLLLEKAAKNEHIAKQLQIQKLPDEDLERLELYYLEIFHCIINRDKLTNSQKEYFNHPYDHENYFELNISEVKKIVDSFLRISNIRT